MKSLAVSATVNGDAAEFLCAPGETLLDALRDRLGLTGAKEGCGTGDRGACSVMLDDTLCAFFPWSGRSRGSVSRASRTPPEVRCSRRKTRASPSGSSLDRRSWSYSRSRSGHESSSCSTPGSRDSRGSSRAGGA